MIFDHIQAHENFEYCLHLLSMIYSPDNYYYVSVDTASRADLTPLIDAAARLDNIQIDRTRSVTTGAAPVSSTPRSSACAASVDGPARYSWFVNISGADVPLAAQSDIMSRLAALSKQGVEACLSFEPPDDMSRVRYHTQQMAPGEAPHVWRSWSGVSIRHRPADRACLRSRRVSVFRPIRRLRVRRYAGQADHRPPPPRE